MNDYNNEVNCSICNKPIMMLGGAYKFPAFVANGKDVMSFYNDRLFHLSCLQTAEGQKAINLAEKCLFEVSPKNRICSIGQNLITSPDNYLFITLLTSNENEILYNLNFRTFDKRNLASWSEKSEFISALMQFKTAGKWEDLSDFKYVEFLINELSC